jgi:DNA-directed RNA polymerase specialized sigma24 family protein
MSDLGSQLSQLTPEQRQAIMLKAQQEANNQVMGEMMQRMTSACFEKCAGTSVSGFYC